MSLVRFVLVIVALAASAVLVACGNDDDNIVTPAGSTATPESASSAPTSVRDQPMDDQDLIFLDAMIVHHQSAIEMAEVVSDATDRSEVRDIANLIMREQHREIEQMMEWRDDWYPGAPSSDLSGMMQMPGMHMSDGDMDSMQHADDVDMEFIEQMIPHHESAVEMARNILDTTERQELRDMAEAIIEAQTGEIEQMREWMSEWSHE